MDEPMQSYADLQTYMHGQKINPHGQTCDYDFTHIKVRCDWRTQYCNCEWKLLPNGEIQDKIHTSEQPQQITMSHTERKVELPNMALKKLEAVFRRINCSSHIKNKHKNANLNCTALRRMLKRK